MTSSPDGPVMDYPQDGFKMQLIRWPDRRSPALCVSFEGTSGWSPIVYLHKPKHIPRADFDRIVAAMGVWFDVDKIRGVLDELYRVAEAAE